MFKILAIHLSEQAERLYQVCSLKIAEFFLTVSFDQVKEYFVPT
ncbi:MAG: hypothetical protein VYA54_01030 [Bdellovibrionota bacterium]|nr:hypothetical protein [Bdellovibrionota bacterium]